jgi:two-component system nitrate/nitrite response regulator NarL
MKKELLNILIVDDHSVVIEGLTAILSQIPLARVVGAVLNAADATKFLRERQVDVVILDINLPDISGIELCAAIKKEFLNIQVIGLSTFKQRSYVSQMIRNGASGYLLKSASKTEIEEAIMALSEGRMFFSEEVNSGKIQGLHNESFPILTRREKEILQFIAEGLTNSEIAQKVFISQYTVDTHRKNLLAKFEVSNTALLIKTAVESGLI